ncbi:MAG TPA: hypothetical protein VGL56_11325 [Fimbriimonadaceae bacterium]|jgi:hypothetical protein
MKIQPTLLKGLAMLVLFPATLAYAQEYSLNDAISGSAIPLTIRPADIPEGFKAVKITQAGAADVFGINSVTSSFTSTAPATSLGAPAEMFLEMLPISWTKGQTVTISGQEFIVTYGIEIGPGTLKGMAGAKRVQPFNLRLKLIKTSDIGTIVPMPEWDKAKYLRAMAQVVVPSTTQVAMRPKPMQTPTPTVTGSIPSTPVLTSEPAPIKAAPDQIASISTDTPTAVKGVSVDRAIDASLYGSAEQNAKAISSAMLLYAQDYDGTFPYVQGSKGAEYVIYPYIKNASVYQTMNPVRAGEFRFNMSLAGVQMNEILDPSNTPLFYDPFAWPNGTYLVGFADSHAKFMTEPEWEMVKKNLALKLKRTGNPLPADYGLPQVTAPSGAAGGH